MCLIMSAFNAKNCGMQPWSCVWSCMLLKNCGMQTRSCLLLKNCGIPHLCVCRIVYHMIMSVNHNSLHNLCQLLFVFSWKWCHIIKILLSSIISFHFGILVLNVMFAMTWVLQSVTKNEARPSDISDQNKHSAFLLIFATIFQLSHYKADCHYKFWL